MIDAEAVARVVQRCPSVARLTPGPGVEVATYLQGRRVPGVRLAEGQVEVHVAARYGPSMPAVAEEIRQALAGHVGDARVAVFIDELDVDELDVDGSDDDDLGANGSARGPGQAAGMGA